jgi:hypothetical protein
MKIPEPAEVGYFAKFTAKRPEWLKTAAVREVCSVLAAADVYAYKVYPLRFDAGEVQPWKVQTRVTELDLAGFAFLGFDIVSRSSDASFECSPLSCNGASDDFPVNRSCLIDDIDTAYNVAVEISRGKYEPGPYHLVEVYRRRQGG